MGIACFGRSHSGKEKKQPKGGVLNSDSKGRSGCNFGPVPPSELSAEYQIRPDTASQVKLSIISYHPDV